MRYVVAAIAVFATFAFAGAAEDVDDVPAKAVAPTRAYNQAVERAQRAYDVAVERATAAYVRALEATKADYTRRGDLDHANAVQALIEEATRAEPIIGAWRIRYSNDTVRTYTFQSGGVVKYDGKAGKWKRDDQSYLVDHGEGKLERVYLVDGRLFVEHFDPAPTIHSGSWAELGVGVRQ